jgi:hypothetical protein
MLSVEGAECKHSAAMTVQHMEKVFVFLQPTLAENKVLESYTVLEFQNCMESLYYLAFSTFCWNIWTR